MIVGGFGVLLCDFGNSNVDFMDDVKTWSIPVNEFSSFSASQKVFYINVNDKYKEILESKENFINLEPFFNFDTIYQGMGIDRIAGCYTISDGIVIDVGSAITVDIMSNGLHLGGYILPGIGAYKKAFISISTALNYEINPNVALDALPQRTADALSYGAIKSIVLMLQETCKDKNVYFTGGDGKFFSKLFINSIYDKSLIFRGMKKVIKEHNLKEIGC